MSKLVALRLLDVHVGHMNEPNVYSLGATALRSLAERGRETTVLHRSRVRGTMDAHLRQLNDVRVEFVLATRGRADVHLRAFHADLDLRRVAGASVPGYIPDSAIELSINAAELALMVEIDLNSEGLAVFSGKAATTVALWQSQAKCWGALPGCWRPVVFAPTGTRAKALSRSIVDVGGGELWLVSEFSVLRERGALGPIFATASEAAATPRALPIVYRGALAPALTSSAQGVRT